MWDVETGKPLTEVNHGANVMNARFSPDGKFIATASVTASAKIWNASNGSEVSAFDGHTDRVNNVEFSPDGTRLLTTSIDNIVRVWDPDVSNSRELVQFTRDAKLLYATWSPNGKKIVTCWGDGAVQLLAAFPWQDTGKDEDLKARIQTWRSAQET